MTKEEVIKSVVVKYGLGTAEDVNSRIRNGEEPEEALSNCDIL